MPPWVLQLSIEATTHGDVVNVPTGRGSAATAVLTPAQRPLVITALTPPAGGAHLGMLPGGTTLDKVGCCRARRSQPISLWPNSPSTSADVKAVTSALVVPVGLVRENPASSEDFASSDSDVALYFTNSGSRASPADFTTAVASAMVVSFALVRGDPASPSPEYSATADSVVAQYFADTRDQASPTDFPTAVVAAQVVPLLQA